ncbi:Os07g0220333, partial [Oryza sativa Japonica Group]
MICSMMRSIFLRFASALRGAIATMDASFDDGKRSATLSENDWTTMACSAARYSSLYLDRLPTEHRSTMSLISLAAISVRFTAVPPDAAAADTSRTSRATSSSRTRRNERTRAAVSSSCVSSRRRWRHRSPYGASATSLPPKLNAAVALVMWRSANAMSLLRRTSCAASGDEATTVGTSPNQSCMTGPCSRASLRIAPCTLSLDGTKWWMLPISGSVLGPGGRLSLDGFVFA